jgi:hypothetical protein
MLDRIIAGLNYKFALFFLEISQQGKISVRVRTLGSVLWAFVPVCSLGRNSASRGLSSQIKLCHQKGTEIKEGRFQHLPNWHP